MSDQNQDDIGISNQELAEQLYDMIMRDIEPDLLSYNIPKLDEYYKDETKEEKEKRLIRYENSYKRFDIEFQKFMNEVQDEVRVNKRSALTDKESEALKQEQNELASIEAAFS